MKIRPLDRENDLPCIYACWCNYIRQAPPFNAMDPVEFRFHKRTIIETLVARDEVAVACHEDHPDQIFGYVCGSPERNVVHFVFVKEFARGRSIASSLLSHMFPWFKRKKIYYTHQSKASRFVEKGWLMQWNPYLIMKSGETLLPETL